MRSTVLVTRSDHDVSVAFLEDNELAEFHTENLEGGSIVGNIYRGVVQDVVPGLQAAFIDVGLERNLFLHYLDIRSEARVMTAPNLEEALQEASEEVIPGRITRAGRRPKHDIRARDVEAPVKPGDTIIVQIVKEDIGTKAPRATTNLAMAGRYVVLLPFPGQSGGVLRRIAMGEDRMRLKKILSSLRSENDSFIMRTAGVGAEEEAVREDVERLRATWKDITKRFRARKKVGLVHSDHEIIPRLVRDAFADDVDEVLVDDEGLCDELKDALGKSMKHLLGKVKLDRHARPLFDRHQIHEHLHKSLAPKIWLKSGGYLIIDENEALTAIDINTGRATGARDLERLSFRINMEAAAAVAREIRLRDIGGIIVVDFIDMLSRDSQRKLTDEFHKHMQRDRSKSTIGKIGDFGLMMLTRKRRGMSLLRRFHEDCPYCQGAGSILRAEEVWRQARSEIMGTASERTRYAGFILVCEPGVASLLSSEHADALANLSQRLGAKVSVQANAAYHREDFQIIPVKSPQREAPVLPELRLAEDERVAEPILRDLEAVIEASAKTAEKEEVAAGKGPDEDDGDGDGRRTRRGRRGGRGRRGRGRDEEGSSRGGSPDAVAQKAAGARSVPTSDDKSEELEEALETHHEIVEEEVAEEVLRTRKRAAAKHVPSPPAKPTSKVEDIRKSIKGKVEIISTSGYMPAGGAKFEPKRKGFKPPSLSKLEASQSAADPKSVQTSRKIQVMNTFGFAPAAEKKEEPKAAEPKAEAPAAEKASKRSARKATKKAAKKATKKAAKKATKKAAKKATKKAAKRTSKKAAKKAASAKEA